MIDKIRSDNVTVDMRRRFGGENIIALSNEQQINDNLIELPICAAATVSDINLNGSVTSLDGIDVTNALFVLVKNQSDLTENGIYIVNPSGWVRWEGLTVNMLCLVVNGDTQENTIWQNTNTELDIGTSEIEFKLLEFGGGGSLPDGTVTNSTLRWNGTEWVESGRVLIADNAGGLNSGDFYVRYNNEYDNYLYLSARAGNAFIIGQVGSFSSFRIGYASVNEIIDIFQFGTRVFSVKQNGIISANNLLANRILVANAGKEIVSLASGTAGQVLMQKAASVVWETLAIPKNRASFLPVQDIFLNKFVTNDPAPYPDPITTYRLLGDMLDTGITPFKATLTAGKRYAVKIRLIFDKTGTTSGYHEFQLKIDGESSWNGFLQYQLTNSFVINPYDDISLDAGANADRIRNIALNQEKAFFYENDTDLDYDILEIEGILTTGTDNGELTISMRNIYRFDADDSNPCVVAQNSFIKAIECEAN